METLVPEGINLLNDVSFSETDKIGDVYVFPIMTKGETGFTVNNQNDAFDLVDPDPAQYSQAKVSPFSIVLQSAISVSYTHLRSPRDRQKSRMPSSA